MEKRHLIPFMFIVMLLTTIALGLSLILTARSTPLHEPTEIQYARKDGVSLMENPRFFRVTRRYFVAVYNYVNVTYINIREILNNKPTRRGVVFSTNEFSHFCRLIPEIRKYVANLEITRPTQRP